MHSQKHLGGLVTRFHTLQRIIDQLVAIPLAFHVLILSQGPANPISLYFAMAQFSAGRSMFEFMFLFVLCPSPAPNGLHPPYAGDGQLRAAKSTGLAIRCATGGAKFFLAVILIFTGPAGFLC
jgi:hypothetical protein